MGQVRERSAHKCSCDDVFTTDWTLIDRRNGKFSKPDVFRYIKVGYGLQAYVGPVACFNYYIRLSYEDFKRSNKGYSFTGKEIDEFTDKDIIDFIIAEPAPVFYSPLFNPHNYRSRKEMILNIIQE